jgi:AraC-like DNA-binding protein
MQTGSLAIPRAPEWARRFATDDPDEVWSFITASVGVHSRVIHGTGLLGFAQSTLSGTAVSLGWIDVGLRTTIRGAVPDPVLHVQVPAGTQYRFGRRVRGVHPGSVTVVAPDWEYTIDRGPGSAFAIRMPRQRLVSEIHARSPGGLADTALASRAVETTDGGRRELGAAVAAFMRATGRDGDATSLAHEEARLLGAVATLLRPRDVLVGAQPVSAARIADLEAWIEAHLEDPITIGRLCAVAGTGERWLQRLFESRRGMSPMRFVTERRLAAARRRLASGAAGVDVTGVATDLGFGHAGRFAASYRQVFGETPSETVRRASGQRDRSGAR